MRKSFYFLLLLLFCSCNNVVPIDEGTNNPSPENNNRNLIDKLDSIRETKLYREIKASDGAIIFVNDSNVYISKDGNFYEKPIREFIIGERFVRIIKFKNPALKNNVLAFREVDYAEPVYEANEKGEIIITRYDTTKFGYSKIIDWGSKDCYIHLNKQKTMDYESPYIELPDDYLLVKWNWGICVNNYILSAIDKQWLELPVDSFDNKWLPNRYLENTPLKECYEFSVLDLEKFWNGGNSIYLSNILNIYYSFWSPVVVYCTNRNYYYDENKLKYSNIDKSDVNKMDSIWLVYSSKFSEIIRNNKGQNISNVMQTQGFRYESQESEYFTGDAKSYKGDVSDAKWKGDDIFVIMK